MAGVRLTMIAVAAAGIAPGACGSPRPAPRPAARSADKAALFADPGLVPTREGERIRSELARAGEISAALAILPHIKRVHVDVERPAWPEAGSDSRSANVLVVAAITPAADAARIRNEIDRIVGTVMMAESPELEVVLAVEQGAPAPPHSRIDLPLALALLGLGLSLGVSADRLRGRFAATLRASKSPPER